MYDTIIIVVLLLLIALAAFMYYKKSKEGLSNDSWMNKQAWAFLYGNSPMK